MQPDFKILRLRDDIKRLVKKKDDVKFMLTRVERDQQVEIARINREAETQREKMEMEMNNIEKELKVNRTELTKLEEDYEARKQAAHEEKKRLEYEEKQRRLRI